jgi:hypothetical protein
MWKPPPRQAAGTLVASGGQRIVENEVEKLNVKQNINCSEKGINK